MAGATAQPNCRVRRVRDVVTDYIEARKNSALAPIAIRTVHDPPGDARVVESSIHLPDERSGPSPRLIGRGPAGLEFAGLLVFELFKDAVAPQRAVDLSAASERRKSR